MQGSRPGEGKASSARDRVVEWLAACGDLTDRAGMAGPQLAQAVGYAGSSVAFAQLLSGMERAGLISREVRGKRTYRVSLAAAGRERASRLAEGGGRPAPGGGAAAHAGAPGGPRGSGRGHGALPGSPDVGGADAATDYDELARRLLLQVAHRLLPPEEEPSAGQQPGPGEARPLTQRHLTALEEKVAVLERELARARAARVALEAENDDLRGQLERIRTNLDQVEARLRPRRQPLPAEPLDQAEIAMLQRVLASRPPDELGTQASTA